ncbi:MAG TPA: class I SAM-dependent methyltransferase [Terriglobales bacterium]|nr:class I SAM-dependent methyltransferase [Terriglobales bacterium]
MDIAQAYDELAEHYHLIFENWEASIERQAMVLGAICDKQFGLKKPARILDCACGIGTQALGLAKLGFQVTGCDISPAAIERARREAVNRKLLIEFSIADMRALDALSGSYFDLVMCMDNALPHLESVDQLRQAAQQMRERLTPGGRLLASIRDYERLLEERPTTEGPWFYGSGGSRRIIFQVWDWIDDRRYMFHLYITTEVQGGWRTIHASGAYRAIRREELSTALSHAGFKNIRWLLSRESGFYQPIILAEAN